MRKITPEYYVAPQITPEDMAEIAAAGIRRVICNRPDSEVPADYQAAAMEQAARAAGLEFAVQPLTHQTMTPDVISRNRALAEGCAGPVLAYCASGTRSTIAWALAAVQEMPVEEVLAAARQAGYELGNLRPALEAAGAR